jgi:hypothetical protein
MRNLAEQLSKSFSRAIPKGEVPLDEIQLMRFPANGFTCSSGNESLVYSPSLNNFFEKDVYEADELMVDLGRAFPEETSYREVSKEIAQIKVLYAFKNIQSKDKQNCLKAGLVVDQRISVEQDGNNIKVIVEGNLENPFFFKDGISLDGNIQNAARFIWIIHKELNN